MGAQLSKRSSESPVPFHHNINGNTTTTTITDYTTITTRVDATAATASSSVPSSSRMQYMAELSSYETACRLDPEVKSFDTTLQQRTSHVISTIATGVEIRSLSFDSLREVTSCLLDMNQC